MRKSLRCVAQVLAVVGVGACSGSKPPPAPPPEQPSNHPPGEPTPVLTETAASEPTQPAPATSAPEAVDVPPEGSSFDRVMQAHFKDALLIRQAVIQGRAEEASRPANVIANIENLDQLPPGWQVFVEHMKGTARRLVNGTTPSSVAAAAADLGVSCGLCHEKHGGPKASMEPAPVVGDSLESRMQLHIWASERLWEGLAIPSNTAWKTGAAALGGMTFPAETLRRGGVDAKSAADDFGRLVAKASSKETIQDRAALYAELLITCGACHTALKPQP